MKSILPKSGVIFVLIISSIATQASAQADEPGVGAGATFNFGVDARALAMGGAVVALDNGYSAPYWNPAGMQLADRTHIGGMYTDKFGLGIDYFYGGGMTKITPISVGVAGVGSSIGDIATFGPGGEPSGTIRDNELLFLGSSAFQLPLEDQNIYLGSNLKYYTHSLSGESGTGFGGDLGALLVSGPFQLGAALSDVGRTSIKWTTGAEDFVDMGIRAGGAITLGANFPLGLVLSGQYDVNAETLRVGSELSFSPVPAFGLALRAGAKQPGGGNFQYSFGFGISILSFTANAAYVQNTALGDSFIISGHLSF